MTKRIFVKTVCVVFAVLCHFFNFTCAQELVVPEIQCCSEVKNVYDADCTYMQSCIEKAVIQKEKDESEDLISITVEQSITTTSNFVYFCMLPLSIITAPIALIAVWVTMYYAIYTNDRLTVFR